MKILGLDPGTKNFGFGMIEEKKGCLLHVVNGVLCSSKKTVYQRTMDIRGKLQEVFAKYRPWQVALEKCHVGRFANAVLALGRSIGVVYTVCADYDLTPHEYTPAEVKRAVLSGNARKKDVAIMVNAMLPGYHITALDATDALAVAICHSNRMGVRV
jgi:crossover junction endodeoxyribonuclease RuvC